MDPSVFSSEIETQTIPVLVQFSADWCPPCKAIAPLILRAADAYEGRVKFLKLNLDVSKDIAAMYGVRAIPALLLFKTGEVVDRFDQERTMSRLSAFLDKHIGAE